MPSAVSRRGSGRVFEPSIAASSLSALIAAKPSSAEQLLLGEPVQLGGVVHERLVAGRQLGDGALAEPLDVHRSPRCEVDDPLVALERARRVDAPGVGLALQAHELGATARARRREDPRLGALGAHRQHRSDDLRDHVAGLAHDHGVAGTHVLGRAPGPRCAASPRRRSSRRRTPAPARRTAWPARCARSRPGCRAARWCAPRAGTCRRSPSAAPATSTPSRLALADVVDLDHDAVDLVAEVVAVVLPVLAVGGHVVERVEHLGLGVDREPQRPQEVEARRVRGRAAGPPTTSPSWYTQNERSRLAVIEASFWRRLPGGRVAGVDEQPLAGRLGLLVHPLEAGRPAGTPRRGPRAPRAPVRPRPP